MTEKPFFADGKYHQRTTILERDHSFSYITDELSFEDRAAQLADEAVRKAQKKRDAQFKATIKALTPWKGSMATGREFASSSLFRVAKKSERLAEVKFETRTARGAAIAYEGPELRQDDSRVLDFLFEKARAAGEKTPCTVAINLMDFAGHIGWERRMEKALQVEQCLRRLMKAVTHIGERGSRVSVQFISKIREVEELGELGREVELHEEILREFQGGCTYRSIEERRALPDGVPSWFASFLRANTDEDLFLIEDLHRWSGSASNIYKFREMLGDASKHIVKAGVAEELTFTYGKVRVRRK